MIKVTLKSEEYYVVEAMAEIEARVDNGLIDPIYDGETDHIEVSGEHWSATFDKA